jgi:two-component system response regulator TrcR
MTTLQVSVPAPRQALFGRLPRMFRADGSPIRALLVDSERASTDLIRTSLRYEGWDVDIAHDAAGAVAKYRADTPDLVVLDVVLPDMGGLGVLEQIRAAPVYTPVLFLTARNSVRDRVAGLTAGGDDYMTKPFHLDELVARLRGLLRRSAYLTPSADDALTVGDLELDGAEHIVTRAGTPISLSSTEFELLRYLMRHPRRAVTRQELLDRVWNYDFGGRSGIVDLYVSYLRKKVDAGRSPMIHTVRGVGYALRPAA